jgi:hypothetical protein
MAARNELPTEVASISAITTGMMAGGIRTPQEAHRGLSPLSAVPVEVPVVEPVVGAAVPGAWAEAPGFSCSPT